MVGNTERNTHIEQRSEPGVELAYACVAIGRVVLVAAWLLFCQFFMARDFET